jgi:serine/threonine protein kinase
VQLLQGGDSSGGASSSRGGGGRRSRRAVTHGTAVDMWSLGTLIYEMIHGLPPFYDTDTHRMYDKILHSRLQFSKFFSATAKDLIARLLDRDAAQRLTVVSMAGRCP